MLSLLQILLVLTFLALIIAYLISRPLILLVTFYILAALFWFLGPKEGSMASSVVEFAKVLLIPIGLCLAAVVLIAGGVHLLELWRRPKKFAADQAAHEAERMARHRMGNYTDEELKRAMDATIEAHRAKQRT